MNLIEAMDDPNLFGRQFSGPSWAPWRAFIATLFGLPVPPDQLELARECTGLSRGAELARARGVGGGRPPRRQEQDLRPHRGLPRHLQATGRAASHLASAATSWSLRPSASRPKHHGFHPGASQGNAAACAPDCVRGRRRDRAHERHHLFGCNALAPCRALQDRDRARFSTRLGSGQDAEASSNSDAEVLAALLPAMATIPGFAPPRGRQSPMAAAASLWRTYERHFGKPGPVLVWHAPTRVMNPLLPASEIERAYAADPARACCEYDAQFRDAPPI